MDSDKKLEMIKEIVADDEPSTIIGPVHYGPQVEELTKAGRSLIDDQLDSGNLSNFLKDCTMIIKIENSKAQVSITHDGIIVAEFKPVHPEFSTTTFEFHGVSIPLKRGW